MEAPTKEQLRDALRKLNTEEGTAFLFRSYGGQGCEGPPRVEVRERRAPTEISVESADYESSFAAMPIDEQLDWSRFYKTTAVAYIEKNRIFYPMISETRDPDVMKIKKRYYYKKYTDVDALAKTLMRVLKRQFKVKVV